MKLKENVIITDIGSTTTKALLIRRSGTQYHFIDYDIAPTTVEAPNEDVKIGIYHAITGLEQKQNISILHPDATKDNITFNPDFTYLTTSSAGGGLQIFVIGLTKVDSALSAQRVAYGVGGVLLDLLSIDDERTALEKFLTLNKSHPDIILFCGGVDGGALNGVYRLAEILKIAKPTPKFAKGKVPLVFAGNCEAIDYIKTLSNDKYELFIEENIRPTLKRENLDPAKARIHNLFMYNVMEQAPGYAPVKKLVASNIIPTPAGVLNTLKILGKQHNYMIAFDIGGATTDIFSNIAGQYYRSVNANSGMSYSIGNVFKDVSYERDIKPYLATYRLDCADYFKNYIGNKVLYPTQNPTTEIDTFIEHLMAICSIKMSIRQHFDMHFQEIDDRLYGYYKQLTKRDFIYETTFHPFVLTNYLFKMSDIEVFIGTGGVISHATPEQAIFMMIESLSVTGITELWRDKNFISPHLGVLSNVDSNIAEYLINNECFEKLAVYVRPKYIRLHTSITLMTVKINDTLHCIKPDNFYSFAFDIDVVVHIFSKQRLFFPDVKIKLERNVRMVIDTRYTDEKGKILSCLNPYKMDTTSLQGLDTQNRLSLEGKAISHPCPLRESSKKCPLSLKGKGISHLLRYSLPFTGDVYVKTGDNVTPTTLLAQNEFDPPLMFVILLANHSETKLTAEDIQKGLLVKINDTLLPNKLIFKLNKINVYSPVRCIVESINYQTGTIIGREIQDYTFDPVEIDICGILGISPRYIHGHMEKKVGDFVRYGDLIARYFPIKYIRSEHTGTIKKIDTKKGTITICYDKKPYQIYAQCYGTVENITNNQEIEVSINALKIEGKIGFGKDIGGELVLFSENCVLEGKVVYKAHVEYSDFEYFQQKQINALICNTISYSCLKRFLGKDIGVALTGNENIPFSLIILDRFANSPIAEPPSALSESEGKYVLLKPFTQIRAGATRPVVYVF